MKNLFSIIFILLAFFAFSCGSGTDTDQTGEETTQNETTTDSEEKEEPAPTVNVPVEGTQYSIKTTESDIPSPRKVMTGTVGEAAITIDYGSPSLRGRTISKELAPYGKLWRTGANKATSFEVSKDVTIGGQSLSAGKYGLFTIPGEENWTVIFNEVWDAWGSGSYDETKDALRLEIPSKMAEEAVEMMDFVVENDKVMLRWGNHSIELPVSA